MKSNLILGLLGVVVMPLTAVGQTEADREAIKRTALKLC